MGFLVDGRGPALLPREACWVAGFGEFGPRDDWRSADEPAGGTERCPFWRRRRLEASEEEERCWAWEARLGVGALATGEELRGVEELGATSRERGLLFAIVVEGPVAGGLFWRVDARGVDALVEELEREGRRWVDGLRREGSCGSIDMLPSFWRSRILRSRRLICRSNRVAAFSLRPTFSSWMICALSKFAVTFLM